MCWPSKKVLAYTLWRWDLFLKILSLIFGKTREFCSRLLCWSANSGWRWWSSFCSNSLAKVNIGQNGWSKTLGLFLNTAGLDWVKRDPCPILKRPLFSPSVVRISSVAKGFEYHLRDPTQPKQQLFSGSFCLSISLREPLYETIETRHEGTQGVKQTHKQITEATSARFLFCLPTGSVKWKQEEPTNWTNMCAI